MSDGTSETDETPDDQEQPPAHDEHGEHDDHHHDPGWIRQYIFSTDHKTIAKQYLLIGAFWGIIGATLAYLFRSQLAYPGKPVPVFGTIVPPLQEFLNGTLFPYIQPMLDSTINQILGEDLRFVLEFKLLHPEGHVTDNQYIRLITMHGTIMLLFFGMPIAIGAFGNFLIPLMIGADDMAFPTLNMLSVWTLALASVVLALSFFVEGGAAYGGWTAYPPLSANPDHAGGALWGFNLWVIAVGLDFFSLLMGGINYITTTLKMRAPGLDLFRLPIMVWMQMVAAFLFLLSVGPLLAGCVMLLLDRMAGTHFFLPEAGGDPLLWQHIFWFWGHPEVYVVMLPGFGVIMEVLPVFSRKKLFGYRPILYMTFAAGFLSFLVWAHHQFVSGMDPSLAPPFMITTILISDPFALMVFAMIVTLWGGAIDLKTPMLFALGTLLVFIIGGVTGIFLASTPVDIALHDTQYVVAHFHYTLFSSVVFGGFCGVYYWFPKMFGRLMNEFWGIVHFLFTFVGFNGVFGSMFLLGFRLHPRRISTPTDYEYLQSVQPINEHATTFATILFLGQIPFLINAVYSIFWGEKAGRNPWNANTLEWQAPSPPGHGNFDEVPTVHRGPYEYGSPRTSEDWLPQSLDLASAGGGGGSPDDAETIE